MPASERVGEQKKERRKISTKSFFFFLHKPLYNAGRGPRLSRIEPFVRRLLRFVKNQMLLLRNFVTARITTRTLAKQLGITLAAPGLHGQGRRTRSTEKRREEKNNSSSSSNMSSNGSSSSGNRSGSSRFRAALATRTLPRSFIPQRHFKSSTVVQLCA